MIHIIVLMFLAGLINGRLFSLMVGVAAVVHGMPIWIAIITTATFSHLITFGYFLFGHYLSSWLPLRNYHIPEKWTGLIQKINHYILSHHIRFILLYRFIPGLGMFSPYIIGASKERIVTYFFVDILAALIWAMVFVGAGALFGTAAINVLSGHPMIELGITLIAVVFVVFYLWWKHRGKVV